jgi:hypothetical protein
MKSKFATSVFPPLSPFSFKHVPFSSLAVSIIKGYPQVFEECERFFALLNIHAVEMVVKLIETNTGRHVLESIRKCAKKVK